MNVEDERGLGDSDRLRIARNYRDEVNVEVEEIEKNIDLKERSKSNIIRHSEFISESHYSGY